MKNKKFTALSLLLATVMLAVVVLPILTTKAVTLTTARDYLSRNQANLSSGVTHEFVFTPATAVSGGSGANSIIIVMPDADDAGWCRTVGALTVTTTNLHESATVLPGTSKTAACAAGSGGSSYDTITISGVDNLSAGTNYGVRVAGSAGVLGTPSSTTGIMTVKTHNTTVDVDTRNIVVSLVTADQITISGRVDPTLTFSVSADVAIGFGAITSAAVRYATADEAGSASVPGSGAPVQLTVTTNAQDGAVIEIRDFNPNSASGLYSVDSGTTLTSVASTAVSLGSEEFGVYGKNSSSLTIDEGFDNDSTSDLAISTSFQAFASAAAPVSSGTVDVTPVAAIAGTTPAGTYADTFTVVATGRF